MKSLRAIPAIALSLAAATSLRFAAEARGAEPGSAPDAMSLRVSAGGEGLLTGEPGSALTPVAKLEVEAPIPLFSGTARDKNGDAYDISWRWPRLQVAADFTGLPGQVAGADIANFDTWKSIEIEFGLAQPVFRGGHQRVSFGIAAGWATRLPGLQEPRDKTARWGQLFAEIAQTEDAAYLRVGIGGDQRLNGDYRLAVIIRGAVRLLPPAKDGWLEQVDMRLVGDAILGLSIAGFVPSTRDVVRVGLVISR